MHDEIGDLSSLWIRIIGYKADDPWIPFPGNLDIVNMKLSGISVKN